MDTILLKVAGHWAHFKKPETNNNPLTHDFITKSALIGMIGAVLGKDREAMKPLFPILSEDLRYGVALQNPVKKQSWAFTLRRFSPDIRNRLEVTTLSPRPFEFLREPCFMVVITLADARSGEAFSEFTRLVERSATHYDPILGLHNCPAEVEIIGRATAEAAEGSFQTRGFVPRSNRPKPPVDMKGSSFRIGFERIPTFQTEDMWNPPNRYAEVVYMDISRHDTAPLLAGDGEHYRLHFDDGKEEDWCLI